MMAKEIAEKELEEILYRMKFKLWNSATKSMSNPVSIGRLQFADGINSTAVVFLQSIGLFDKNGVEIYEGDFVRIAHYDDMEYENENDNDKTVIPETAQICLVKRKGIVSGNFGDYNSTLLEWLVCDSYSCEVIGNKFENPEWIEASDENN